jgi:hypothetical protein
VLLALAKFLTSTKYVQPVRRRKWLFVGFWRCLKRREKKRSAILALRLWRKRQLELESCYFVYLNVKWLRQDISSFSSSQNKKYCGLCGSELIPQEANLNV